MRQLLVPVFSLLALSAAAQEAAPKFAIKDAEARTGSKFRRELITSTSIPLNMPYEKLTEQEKASLKSNYESMGPDDEPPFPAAGLAAIVTEMSEAQKILQVQGNLRLHAQVDATGKVSSVVVAESVDRQFDIYVSGILMRAKFKPAKCAGVPCNQDYLFAWTLTLAPR